jgi:hypothetical protein
VSDPINPMNSLQVLHKFGPMFAKAKATRVYLEEYRKTLKALKMKDSGETSAAAQEREAYAHADYVQHLDALRAAVEDEETMRWKLIAAQAAIETWRSQEASNRAMDKAAA